VGRADADQAVAFEELELVAYDAAGDAQAGR
jgi:hypothetical protein